MIFNTFIPGHSIARYLYAVIENIKLITIGHISIYLSMTSELSPVHADGGQIQDGRRAAHDVHGNPRIT